MVLDRTPFYADSGGQGGDAGYLRAANGAEFEVSDTRKQSGAVFTHVGELRTGELRVGDPVTAEVNAEQRSATALNHSATHLLHAALRHLLGEHVGQKGSLVEADRLRFDFSHFEPVSRDQLLPALLDGHADLAAGDLTITDERARVVDFTRPLLTDINEVVVTGPVTPPEPTMATVRTAVWGAPASSSRIVPTPVSWAIVLVLPGGRDSTTSNRSSGSSSPSAQTSTLISRLQSVPLQFAAVKVRLPDWLR